MLKDALSILLSSAYIEWSLSSATSFLNIQTQILDF